MHTQHNPLNTRRNSLLDATLDLGRSFIAFCRGFPRRSVCPLFVPSEEWHDITAIREPRANKQKKPKIPIATPAVNRRRQHTTNLKMNICANTKHIEYSPKKRASYRLLNSYKVCTVLAQFARFDCDQVGDGALDIGLFSVQTCTYNYAKSTDIYVDIAPATTP